MQDESNQIVCSKFLPTDPYDKLLHAVINQAQLDIPANPTLDKSIYSFPNHVENSFRLLTFYKFEVLHKLNGIAEWPRTRENQLLKTKLAHDLILWYKSERPDILHIHKHWF